MHVGGGLQVLRKTAKNIVNHCHHHHHCDGGSRKPSSLTFEFQNPDTITTLIGSVLDAAVTACWIIIYL